MFNFFSKNKFHKDIVIFQNDISVENSIAYYRELLASASSATLGGFSVEYIKYNMFDKNSLKDKIFVLNMYSPKLFLFETDGFNLQSVLKASSLIRKEIPSSKIALICNEKIADKLSSLDIFNFFILGDSDLVIIDILKNIDSFSDKIINPICDSEAKTAFLNFDLISILPKMPYFSSRHVDEIGNFTLKNNKKEFLYSSERVLFELKQLIKIKKVKNIDISDFAFMKDEKRFEDICLSLSELKKELKMPLISCFADVKVLSRHPEYFDLMKDAGIKVLNIVIGSSDSDSRKFYGLEFENEDIEKIVKYASKCGKVLLKGIFYIASPYDDEDIIKKSCEFGISLSNIYPLGFDMSFVNIYPKIGSIMYDYVKTIKEPQDENKYLYTDDPDFDFLSDFSFPIYYTANMDLEKIQNTLDYLNDNEIPINTIKQLVSPDMDRLILNNNLYNNYFYKSYTFSIVKTFYSYIIDYLNLLTKTYFVKISDLNRTELLDSFPIKTIASTNYLPYKNDGYIIENAPQPIIITDEIEVDAFEYALGKLKLKDIIKRIISDFPDKNLNEDELLENILIPFYKKMEDKFVIIFFR